MSPPFNDGTFFQYMSNIACFVVHMCRYKKRGFLDEWCHNQIPFQSFHIICMSPPLIILVLMLAGIHKLMRKESLRFQLFICSKIHRRASQRLFPLVVTYMRAHIPPPSNIFQLITYGTSIGFSSLPNDIREILWFAPSQHHMFPQLGALVVTSMSN